MKLAKYRVFAAAGWIVALVQAIALGGGLVGWWEIGPIATRGEPLSAEVVKKLDMLERIVGELLQDGSGKDTEPFTTVFQQQFDHLKASLPETMPKDAQAQLLLTLDSMIASGNSMLEEERRRRVDRSKALRADRGDLARPPRLRDMDRTRAAFRRLWQRPGD